MQNVSKFKGAPDSTGLWSQVWATRSWATNTFVMLWGLHGVIICLFTPYPGVMQASLCLEKESPSQNSAFGQGQWCLTLAPCQETSRNTYNLHLSWWVYHGVQLSCLRMGHFRHFTLYSESFLWGRTALHVSATLWFTCCPWHQMASDETRQRLSQ